MYILTVGLELQATRLGSVGQTMIIPVETGMRICWTGTEGLPEPAPATAACWLRKN